MRKLRVVSVKKLKLLKELDWKLKHRLRGSVSRLRKPNAKELRLKKRRVVSAKKLKRLKGLD